MSFRQYIHDLLTAEVSEAVTDPTKLTEHLGYQGYSAALATEYTTYFQNNPPDVIHMQSINPTKIPVWSLVVGRCSPAERYLGNKGYTVHTGTESYRIASYTKSVDLNINTYTKDPQITVVYQDILEWMLYRNIEAIVSEVEDVEISSEDVIITPDVGYQELFCTRSTLHYTETVEFEMKPRLVVGDSVSVSVTAGS